MDFTQTLIFLWTPWSLAISAIIILVTAGLCLMAWQRSGYARSQGILEFIRLVIVVLLATMLNQPEWVEEFRPEENPQVLILVDNSPSMLTLDVESTITGSKTTSRKEAIASLTAESAWAILAERMDVTIQPFGNAAAGTRSDLFTPLKQAPNKFSNLIGAVLISDGDWNEGQPPVQAATSLRMKEIPIFTVPVGSPVRLPDVELLSLGAPTFGVAGKAVRIPFTVESTLPREFITTVKLKSSSGEEITRDVRISPMGRTSDSLLWSPESTGDFTLTLTVPKHTDDTLPDNNQLTAPIAIREEKLKVLVVESFPRWEYRYLKNALSRDPGVEVSCLLFHPGLDKVGGGSKDYIKEFPGGLDELSKFDVVFLGDVGLEEGQLTTENCRLLKGIVEHQASGLVFMPGGRGRQVSLQETELDDLYPVIMDELQPDGWGSRTPGHFELTELGRRSLLTRLADTRDDNLSVWEDLPGFQWYAAVVRAKNGCETLAVHQDIANKHGRIPLLVTRTFGAGKVLFMGTDGAWRWREGVEDKYHYRFWGQVVRWMAYQRNMAKGETMRLYYAPDQPQVRQTLVLHANVVEASGEPLAKGDVTARITSPLGKAETVRFTSSGDEWGVFDGRFTSEESGNHQVRLFCKQTNATLDTSFFVQGDAAETPGKSARPEVMEEIARVSHGKVLAPDQLEQLVQSLASLPEPSPSIRRVQLWSHPATVGLILLLLTIFWIGRKAVGLV
ncbi:MAG: hypothetical protein P8M20_12325 [Planctomycetaceae bacterium]|nr:hypothetical protein [Planctomycetaceae bacterium]